MGIYVVTQLDDLKGAFEDGFSFAEAIPAVAISLGLFILIGSVLGCLGAVKENTCMIKGFLMFLVLTMLAEIGIAAAVIVYNTNENVEKEVDEYMAIPFNNCEGQSTANVACKWLPTVQELLECCGYDPTFSGSNESNANNYLPYDQLCYGENKEAQEEAIENAKAYCNNEILEFFKSRLVYVAGIVGGIFFVEIVLVVATCYLVSAIKDDNKYA